LWKLKKGQQEEAGGNTILKMQAIERERLNGSGFVLGGRPRRNTSSQGMKEICSISLSVLLLSSIFRGKKCSYALQDPRRPHPALLQV